MSYFDHNATSPLHPAAREAWLEVVSSSWHNPSGLYPEATAARERLEDARERCADVLEVEPSQIAFTGGATAAANLIARFHARQSADGSVVTSGIEHPCVTDSLAAAFAGRMASLPVDTSGVVDLVDLERRVATTAPPRLVAVMAASNETGVLQPWKDVARLCQAAGVAFLCDASQWFGKRPAAGLGACGWVIGSSHKFGGPRGTGFVVIPEGEVFRGDLGGPQEAGRHAGTEDVASVVAMVAALEARERELAAFQGDLTAARDAAQKRLAERLPEAVVVGRQASRLWNTLAAVIPGGDGKRLVGALGRAGVAASTGSACSAGAGSLPHSLAAIGAGRLGLTPADLRGMVRLSSGLATSVDEWFNAVEKLVEIVRGASAGPPRVSLTGMPSRRPPAQGLQP